MTSTTPPVDTGHISPIVITGSSARRTIICPNYMRLVTRRSSRFVLVRWHTITKVHDHGEGVFTHSVTNFASIVRGSNDIAIVRGTDAKTFPLGHVVGTSHCTASGSFIVDLATGEVVK